MKYFILLACLFFLVEPFSVFAGQNAHFQVNNHENAAASQLKSSPKPPKFFLPQNLLNTKYDGKSLMRAGLVCSFVALAFFGLFFPVGIILGALAAILGFAGIKKQREVGDKNISMGVIAIVIGGLGFVIIGAFLSIFVLFVIWDTNGNFGTIF